MGRVTREEVLAMFDKHISPLSPTRIKLSVRVCARALVRKFSKEAGKAFSAAVIAKGVSLVDGEKDTLEEEPTLQAAKDTWSARLKDAKELSAEDLAQLMDLMEDLAMLHPAGVDSAPTPSVKVEIEPVVVKDKDAFKAKLELGPFPEPQQHFQDF